MLGEKFGITGISRQSASAGLVEQFYIEQDALVDVLTSLTSSENRGGLAEAVLLSTCDRTDVFYACTDSAAAQALPERIKSRLAGQAAIPVPDIPPDAFYQKQGAEAVRHLLRVACALDSKVVGESQILGQFKAACSIAREAGLIGSVISPLIDSANRLARKVRSDTHIGSGALSIASAASRLSKDLFSTMRQRPGLIIGLGEIGEIIADYLEQSGIARFDLTGPARRTQREAAFRGRRYRPFDSIQDYLSDCDIVIMAHGAGSYLLERSRMEAVLRARRRRLMLLFDCGMPTDCAPETRKVDDLYLYTYDDLVKMTEETQSQRSAAAQKAESMVEAHLASMEQTALDTTDLEPALALRARFEAERADILDQHPTADASKATRLLINRLLHTPTLALRGEGAGENHQLDAESLVIAAQILFPDH